MVACILMHDRFYAARDVAHGFIEYRAVIITTINFVQQVARYEGDKIKCGGFF